MAVQKNKRALGLDALRGFAILTMFLSGLVPFYKNTLPSWMYHAQLPPPLHKFDPALPGLTWVDLVFPFFLFAMGAAFPFALSRRQNKGDSYFNLLSQIFVRFLLLAGFAIYIQHIKPYALSPEPELIHWVIALLGFALLFPVLYRFSPDTDKKIVWSSRILGIAAIIILMALLKYPDGSGFSVSRSDIIILVLSNVALFGSIIWLFTRDNLLMRLAILGVLLAIRLSHTEIGWVKEVWDFTPFPWLYKLYYLQYLFIVIPGTIIGDLFLKWMKEGSAENEKPPENKKLVLISLGMIAIVLVNLIGLHGRWVTETVIISIVLLTGIWFIMKDSNGSNSKLILNSFYWAAYFLILGLFFEPYEGGIKKDHPTLSYYFVTTGLAIFSLIFFTIIIDFLKKKSWCNLLIVNGQNPMIAYAGISNLVPPLLALTYIGELLRSITQTPWLGFLRGLLITILLGYIVKLFTKYKIFLRT